jgi:GDP-L-fucose synthase
MIEEFARVVAAAVGYAGEISFDTSRPDGTHASCSIQAARETRLARVDETRGRDQARLSGVP